MLIVQYPTISHPRDVHCHSNVIYVCIIQNNVNISCVSVSGEYIGCIHNNTSKYVAGGCCCVHEEGNKMYAYRGGDFPWEFINTLGAGWNGLHLQHQKVLTPSLQVATTPPSENMLEKMLQRTRVNERHLGIEDSDFQKIFKDIEMYITI